MSAPEGSGENEGLLGKKFDAAMEVTETPTLDGGTVVVVGPEGADTGKDFDGLDFEPVGDASARVVGPQDFRIR